MLKTTYDSLAVEGLKRPLEEVATACKNLGINFFIIGAIARNIWLATNDQRPSGTKDIDFGVFVADIATYNQLRETLTSDFDYTASRENAFCMITPDGKPIDLLPFGEIETNSEVRVKGVGLTSVKLDGFKDVFERGTIDVEIGQEIYQSCSIPGVVILKMIAYDDRPEMRGKDVEDIAAICQHYPILEDENIWANHSDLYDDDLEHVDVGMIVLGREMSTMIADNDKLRSRVVRVLNQAISLESGFIQIMIKDPAKETIDEKRQMLRNILKGLTEGKTGY
jgi:predicted nucleotidyltransferase